MKRSTKEAVKEKRERRKKIFFLLMKGSAKRKVIKTNDKNSSEDIDAKSFRMFGIFHS